MVLYLFNLDLEEECQKVLKWKNNHFRELPHPVEESIQEKAVMILTMIEDCMKIIDPMKEEDIKVKMGRPPDRRRYQEGGYSRRGYPNQEGTPSGRGRPPDGRGRPPDNGGTPDNGGPPDDGGPPNDGGPPGNGWNTRYPGGQGPPGPQGPPRPVRPVIVQMPQVTLDTTAL